MGKEVFCFNSLSLVEKDFHSKSKLNTINSKKQNGRMSRIGYMKSNLGENNKQKRAK